MFLDILICKKFYLYKNKMVEKNSNLEWDIDVSDLDSLGLDTSSLDDLDIDDVLESTDSGWEWGNVSSDAGDLSSETLNMWSNVVNESVFLEEWDEHQLRKTALKDGDNFGSYLRRFFVSSVLIIIGLWSIVILYLFHTYIKEASSPNPDPAKQEYIDMWKSLFKWVKGVIWKDNNYVSPTIWSADESLRVNEIINATDIDYIEKKELLSKYISDLVRNAENNAVYVENLKQDIAKQWFLPEELWSLLSEDQAIDTIQRSLNALEVIKFSTATRVFLYMNTALSTISEMIRVSWANVDSLHDLFEMISWRWEKDISSYVYMCYLNPFEVSANCDAVGDLDLYYKIAKDNSIDIKLFKNSMNAISQLLEKGDTTLFSITFNWFNAADKNIQFNVEVYTNQEDERALMSQWKRNPNIFILTNIINLLKQSSFIIGAEINTKEINVDTRTITQWWISRSVNYSTMDFTVPIQKNTEREIFDYIDLNSMKKLLSDRWFKKDSENNAESLGSEKDDINGWGMIEDDAKLGNIDWESDEYQVKTEGFEANGVESEVLDD